MSSSRASTKALLNKIDQAGRDDGFNAQNPDSWICRLLAFYGVLLGHQNAFGWEACEPRLIDRRMVGQGDRVER
jgi:hypothetical protein